MLESTLTSNIFPRIHISQTKEGLGNRLLTHRFRGAILLELSGVKTTFLANVFSQAIVWFVVRST